MIKLTDATRLAYTKLRARKIRTIVTIILASMLFGVLVALSLVMTGVFDSLDNFRKDGLTSRYIVNIRKTVSGNTVQQTLRDPDMILEAKKRYELLIQKKTTDARRLGLVYTPAGELPPYRLLGDGSTEALSINDSNGIVNTLLTERYSTKPAFDDEKLQRLASKYHATGIFASKHYTISRGSSLNTLDNNKEVFYDHSDKIDTNSNFEKSLVDGDQMVVVPSEISKPFMLANNANWRPDSNLLPIVLPQNIVEQLLKIDKLPDKASAKEKLERIKMVRMHAASLTFRACYRDDASNNLIQMAIRQQKDMRAHKNDSDYQKPSLIYGLPDPTKCETPIVISDTRNTDEKKQDINQDLFDEEYGKDVEPTSYFVSFKVVGISPSDAESGNQSSGQSISQIRSLNDVVASLLKTSGIGQLIPQELYEQIPDKSRYADLFTYKPMYLFGNEDNSIRYIEFANAQDAERFIDNQSCTMQYDNICRPAGRPYQASLVFSNSVALDDIRIKTSRWFDYVIIGVAALASSIMWITVGRTIVDGRHETAVFRAIGFKRIDIALIYTIYTGTLSVLVVVFAVIVGTLGALIVNHSFAPDLTAQAQYGFGGYDLSKEINLISPDLSQLCLILVACLITGILSMVVPLVRNVRRSPVRDMREE